MLGWRTLAANTYKCYFTYLKSMDLKKTEFFYYSKMLFEFYRIKFFFITW